MKMSSFGAASFVLNSSFPQTTPKLKSPRSSSVPSGLESKRDRVTLSGSNSPSLNLIPKNFGTASSSGSAGGRVALGSLVGRGEGPKVGTVSSQQLDFTQGNEVVSGAQKFILPVPSFQGGGEALVYPKGATDKSGTSLAGKPITDWQGKPIGKPGEKGVVFFNQKDQSWQAVKADGKGVIILNQVNEEQGKSLQSLVGKDPSKLSLGEFKQVLEKAAKDPSKGGLGLGDMYNSDKDFISSKMNKLETADTGVAHYGLHRRDDRDLCHCVYISGSGEFQGPAASPQKFQNGAVVVRQPDSKSEDGFSYRLVQPDAFKETYKNKDGSPIKISKLSNQTPRT